MPLPDPMVPNEGSEQPTAVSEPDVAPAAEDVTRGADGGAAPTGSVATGLSLMIFGAVMVFVMATVCAFILSERSALRRADAAHFGALVDQATLSMSEDLVGAAMGDTMVVARLRRSLGQVAEISGVRRVSLLVPGAEEPWTVTNAGAESPTAAEPIALDGPQRQLDPDRLIVKRTFLAAGQERIRATLFLEAGYPAVERGMRDLIGLAGRIVGITALFLVFLLPVLTRLCLAPISRLAEAARGGLVPDMDSSYGELQAISERLRDDAELMAQLSRERAESINEAREQMAQHEFEQAQLQARLAAAVREGRGGHRAKEAFVANMSHEIRTPLHSVLGTTSLLLETNLNAEQQALGERALRSSKALLSLVEDIMELTKFDSRSIEMVSEPLDPGALLEETAELSADAAAAKGLCMATYVDPALPATQMGDARRIRQALMRLVDNAIKFTDAGEITLEVSSSEDEYGLPLTVFKVTDTGLGIDDRERARLFQAFEQLDKSDTRKHGGVGLGLALVARIARAAGGEVRLESRRGQGTTFTLVLPLREAAGERGSAPRGSEPRHQGVRIMLVEQAPGGATLLARTLEESGAEVNVQHSAYSAFEVLLQQECDVLLIDPRVTGSEALFDAVGPGDRRVEVGVGLITFPTASAARLHPAFRTAKASARRPLTRAGLLELVDGALGREQRERPTEAPGGLESLLATDIRCRLRILLVEDNQANQQLVQFLLRRRGYHVDVASNGMLAVEAATRVRYDAILMDCQMPEMDGYEATRRIRTVERMDRRRTPILAMTASILEGDRARCLEAGMDDTIGKPFQPNEMLAWLERWLLAAARTRESDSDLDPFVEDSASGGEQSAVTLTDIFGTSTGASGDDRSEESPDAVRVETVQEQAPAEVEEELATAAGAAQELGALAPEPSDVDPAPSEVPSAPGGASESGTDFVEPDFESVGEILDVSILEPLFEDADGRELALELVASFLEMAPELLNRMEEAVGADDLETCARIAHRFVSTSGTVGANQLATLLKDIEQQAIAGRAEDAASLVSGCHELVELAGGALRTALAGGDGARS